MSFPVIVPTTHSRLPCLVLTQHSTPICGSIDPQLSNRIWLLERGGCVVGVGNRTPTQILPLLRCCIISSLVVDAGIVRSCLLLRCNLLTKHLVRSFERNSYHHPTHQFILDRSNQPPALLSASPVSRHRPIFHPWISIT